MDIRIDPLVVPATLDAADAADFVDLVRIGNAEWRRASGTDLHDDDPHELLGRLRETPYSVTVGAVARVDGRVVGGTRVDIDKTTSESAEVDLVLAEGHDDGSVADALLAESERIARRHGRTLLHTWTIHRPDPVDDRLVPPTGAGWIPERDAATRRMLRAGYALGQVERNSAFDLDGPYDAVRRLLESALTKAGPDYRPVWWVGATPPAYAAGYAKAIARMSSDVPAGELSFEQSVWDAERVLQRDVRFAEAGVLMGVTLVIHEPTGEVAAFNELSIARDRTRPTSQWGTLVMPEHRGRRLGTIVKCIGLQRWHEHVPESPVVSTFNAEENRYMLDVNEAVGFAPAGYAGAWEKRLA
ncbi:GNAT family N-acetyltransferase [Microbacterium marinilacus]|uniref:N-acetyltransferase domain-containing protein n=1 Tax=Microbacterium marinilacus TaxID=415209 RepID=A0ABP7B4C3_9MICO|nr:GNAT family N-acetyltransferase [Microbacterium marinilacus]MBY0687921.1 GNAT family N-acetyltransferase [Microbacterium marinilacus]